MYIGVAVQAESDGPRAEDDARRAELARHLRPYRPTLESVHVVHVPHRHRERPVRRARPVVVLRFAVAHESVAVADDDEYGAPVDLALSRLLRHETRHEREAVELVELSFAERKNGLVLGSAPPVFLLRREIVFVFFFFFLSFPLTAVFFGIARVCGE